MKKGRSERSERSDEAMKGKTEANELTFDL